MNIGNIAHAGASLQSAKQVLTGKGVRNTIFATALAGSLMLSGCNADTFSSSANASTPTKKITQNEHSCKKDPKNAEKSQKKETLWDEIVNFFKNGKSEGNKDYTPDSYAEDFYKKQNSI